MSASLKAIETRYNGYRFRSRLEARWGVFMSTLGVTYDYEKEGFELPDGQRYLPDFFLPTLDCWAEIKGERLDAAAAKIFSAFATAGNTEHFLLEGSAFAPGDYARTNEGELLGGPTGVWADWSTAGETRRLSRWAECAICGGRAREGQATRFFGFHPSLHWSRHRGDVHTDFGHLTDFAVYDSPDLWRAYDAARSARFEFAERG